MKEFIIGVGALLLGAYFGYYIGYDNAYTKYETLLTRYNDSRTEYLSTIKSLQEKANSERDHYLSLLKTPPIKCELPKETRNDIITKDVSNAINTVITGYNRMR